MASRQVVELALAGLCSRRRSTGESCWANWRFLAAGRPRTGMGERVQFPFRKWTRLGGSYTFLVSGTNHRRGWLRGSCPIGSASEFAEFVKEMISQNEREACPASIA
jgi:hypothetical protein